MLYIGLRNVLDYRVYTSSLRQMYRKKSSGVASNEHSRSSSDLFKSGHGKAQDVNTGAVLFFKNVLHICASPKRFIMYDIKGCLKGTMHPQTTYKALMITKFYVIKTSNKPTCKEF